MGICEKLLKKNQSVVFDSRATFRLRKVMDSLQVQFSFIYLFIYFLIEG